MSLMGPGQVIFACFGPFWYQHIINLSRQAKNEFGTGPEMDWPMQSIFLIIFR